MSAWLPGFGFAVLLAAAIVWLLQESAWPAEGIAAEHAVSVAAGYSHTCALTTEGAVRCWGRNDDGQLGDGTFRDRNEPAPEVDLGERAQSITAGTSHTCALTESGAVRCWGSNTFGELGAAAHEMCGENVPSECTSRPVTVSGLEQGAKQVSAGLLHTCAVTQNGAVKCWGSNTWYVLGIPSDPYSHSVLPVEIGGLPGSAASVAAGGYHTCALMVSGTVHCWGNNRDGALGNETIGESSAVPVPVLGLEGPVEQLVSGSSLCALTVTRHVLCWGGVPKPIEGLEGVVRLSSSASSGSMCAILEYGKAKCWGFNNYGQLGDGTVTSRRNPVEVSVISAPIVDMAIGAEHSCAVIEGGSIKCLGSDLAGQLGDGNPAQLRNLQPVRVVGFGTEIGREDAATASITVADGAVAATGQNPEVPVAAADDREDHSQGWTAWTAFAVVVLAAIAVSLAAFWVRRHGKQANS